MQDIQNIPNPDVNSPETNDDFGNHSEREDVENIPLPGDEPKPASIEEPPDTDRAEIEEDDDPPIRIL